MGNKFILTELHLTEIYFDRLASLRMNLQASEPGQQFKGNY